MNRRDFLLGTLGATAFFSQLGCGKGPAKPKRTGFLYSDFFLEHDSGESHAESPERLIAIRDRIRSAEGHESLLPPTHDGSGAHPSRFPGTPGSGAPGRGGVAGPALGDSVRGARPGRRGWR